MAAVTVETKHSTYEFDTEAKTFTRRPAHPDASNLDGDGEVVHYNQVAGWQFGAGVPLAIWLANGKIRTTTPVVRVTQDGKEVPTVE